MAERKRKFGPSRYLFEESKRNYDFDTQIDNFIVNTQQKMLIVAREAITDLIEDAQIPVSKGGKMRVLTGFLRSTGIASLNAPPIGPNIGDSKKNYQWDGDTVNKALATMKLGDSFYFGWTANYARIREAYDGFLESSVQKWQSYVNESIRKFKK
jgi:hypothetical protein